MGIQKKEKVLKIQFNDIIIWEKESRNLMHLLLSFAFIYENIAPRAKNACSRKHIFTTAASILKVLTAKF